MHEWQGINPKLVSFEYDKQPCFLFSGCAYFNVPSGHAWSGSNIKGVHDGVQDPMIVDDDYVND